MAGLHLLKHAKGLSDEQVCAQWVETPYFQAFCGEAWFPATACRWTAPR
jgi:transposase, IS5 family